MVFQSSVRSGIFPDVAPDGAKYINGHFLQTGHTYGVSKPQHPGHMLSSKNQG
jgi:hypothetical protein